MTFRFLCTVSLLCLVPLAGADSDPWTVKETLAPADLAAVLATSAAPQIFMVGPRVLYNGAHIRGAVYAGPAGKPEGLDNLAKAVAGVAKDQALVIYCGCCPMEKCPNIRPAFQKLKELGYAQVKVLIIPTNLHEDWTGKGYPVEKGDVSR